MVDAKGIAGFLSRHWGEIYTGIDILSNFAAALAGGGEVPETLDGRVKGLMGLFGLKDERIFLTRLRTLRERDPNSFKRVMQYLSWEYQQAAALDAKIGGAGVWLIRLTWANRFRVLISGIEDKPGSTTGKRTETFRIHHPMDGRGGRGRGRAQPRNEIRTEKDITQPGSSPAVDILIMLGEEIDRNWLAISNKYRDQSVDNQRRWNTAFEMTKAEFRVPGLPRIPEPDEVPNLKGLVDWVAKHGQLPMQFLTGLAEAAVDALRTEVRDAANTLNVAWLDLEHRKRRGRWRFAWPF